MNPLKKEELAAQLEDDLEDLEGAGPIDWAGWLTPLALLFGYLAVAWVLGLCAFSPGARLAKREVAAPLLFAFVGTLGFVHFLMVQKWEKWVLPQLENKTVPAVRIFLSAALWGVPSLSLAYFIGHARELMEWQELVVAVIPACLMAAILLETQRKAYVASLFLVVVVFLNLFVINDVFAPFYTVFNYASRGASFYFIRCLCPPLAIAVCVFLSPWKPAKKASLNSLGFVAWMLLLYSLSIQYLLPYALQAFQNGKEPLTLSHDLGWLVQAVVIGWIFFRRNISERALFVLTCTAMLAGFWPLRGVFQSGEANVWNLALVTQSAAVILFYGYFAFRVRALLAR